MNETSKHKQMINPEKNQEDWLLIINVLDRCLFVFTISAVTLAVVALIISNYKIPDVHINEVSVMNS